MYEYRARVLSVYDGDTIRADIDLGLCVKLCNQQLRLYGINTPEVRGSYRLKGIAARDALRSLIDGEDVKIVTHKDRTGKYGRWLVEVWFREIHVNEWLLQNGYAEVYD